MKVTKKGMEAIANLRDYIYGKNKTLLTKEDVEILQRLDKVQDAYEELFIAYAQEKMNNGR